MSKGRPAQVHGMLEPLTEEGRRIVEESLAKKTGKLPEQRVERPDGAIARLTVGNIAADSIVSQQLRDYIRALEAKIAELEKRRELEDAVVEAAIKASRYYSVRGVCIPRKLVEDLIAHRAANAEKVAQ